MKIFLVGNLSQNHCSEVHWAATLEDLGHAVTRQQENEIKPGTLNDLVRGHDLFIWVRTWAGFVTHQDIEEIRKLGIPSVNIHLDLFIGLPRGDSLDTDPRWRCDHIFTADGDPASQAIFESKDINHHWLKAGVFKPEAVYGNPRPKLMTDVTFVGGGVTYGHFNEWPYRRQLVTWLKNTYGSRYTKYGHPEPTMRNQDLNDLYASAKIVVGDSLCPGFTKPNFWSDRVYETIGRGGFIIHPYIEGLEDEFTLDGPDKNLVTYEYGNFDQLKELIDYYLTHDEERERIRKAGHEYVKEHCTYHNRLQQMIDTVFPRDEWVETEDGGYTNPSLNAALNEFMSQPDKINLGAGADPTEGYINVDLLDLPGIDVVHNLMDFPYPFGDESATHIRAVDVIEHLANYTDDRRPTIIAFIEECHRILKQGGELFIQTPGYDAEFLWQDPTHVRGFHPKSMDLFDPDTEFGKTTGFYSEAKFYVSFVQLSNKNLQFTMVKR